MLLVHISDATTVAIHIQFLPLQATEQLAEKHSRDPLLLFLPVPAFDELALSTHHGELKCAGKF
jgi:hypothetical protein